MSPQSHELCKRLKATSREIVSLAVRAKDMLLDFLIFTVEGLAGETLKVVPELCFDRVFHGSFTTSL